MSPISDQELQRHLARRTSKSLPAGDREDVLAAVAGARARPRFSFRMRPSLLLAPIAALVLVVLVGVPLLWTIAPGPGPSQSPSPSAPLATASPWTTVTIYTAQQLSDMIGDPAWVGHYVLAQASLGPSDLLVDCAYAPCVAKLLDVSGNSSVTIAPRDAPSGTGFQMSDGHWVVGLAIPASPGALAFKIASDSVEFLGPANLAADGSPMTVPAAQSSAPSNAVDDVYVVSGWLVATSPVPCPPPPPSSPQDANLDYWCGRSWVTATEQYTVNSGSYSLVMDGLHAQSDAYDIYATNPVLDTPKGSVPNHGTYLMRPAGCPAVVMGDCPVWRMVGRLDDTSAITAPPTSPSPSQAPLDVLTQDQLIAMANDPLAVGRVVIADVNFQPAPTGSAAACVPPDPCPASQIGLSPLSQNVAVYSGWRDSTTDGAGTYVPSQGRWVFPLLPSADGGTMAFRVLGQGEVEYLGLVESNGAQLAWLLNDVPTGASFESLYAVSGWLVRTQEVPCPAPLYQPQNTDQNYMCGGSFLTATQAAIAQAPNDLDPGGLHVQWSAYNDFAANPAPIDVGMGPPAGTSDQGVYLVRRVGQRQTTFGQQNVWRMVGRLEPPMTTAETPTPSPTPSVPVEIDGQPVLSTDQAQQQIEAGYAGTLLIAGQVVNVSQFCAYTDALSQATHGLISACGAGPWLYGMSGSDAQIQLFGRYDGPLPVGIPGVLRVHTNDPVAAACPEAFAQRCRQSVFVDGAAWPHYAPDELSVTFCSVPTQATIDAFDQTFGLSLEQNEYAAGVYQFSLFRITDGTDAWSRAQAMTDPSVCGVQLSWTVY